MTRKRTLVLYSGGQEQCDYVFKNHRKLAERFRNVFSYFEKSKSSRGKYDVSDGITWDAVYCMRDILRELPISILNGEDRGDTPLSDEDFMNIIASSYANERDREITPGKSSRITVFQNTYLKIVDQVAKKFGVSRDKALLQITMRSSSINRYDRITGDSILHVTNQIMRDRNKRGLNETMRIIMDFISYQKLRPGKVRERTRKLNELETKKSRKVIKKILQLVRVHRESL